MDCFTSKVRSEVSEGHFKSKLIEYITDANLNMIGEDLSDSFKSIYEWLSHAFYSLALDFEPWYRELVQHCLNACNLCVYLKT